MIKTYLYKTFNHFSLLRFILNQIVLPIIHHRLYKWIVFLAERSLLFKFFITFLLHFIWWSHFKRIKEEGEQLLRNYHSPSIPYNKKWVIWDMLFCNVAYGALPEDYLIFEFHLQSALGRRSFITNRLRNDYCRNKKINDITPTPELFTDKFITYQRYKSFYKREIIRLYSTLDIKLFSDFISESPNFICKPINSSKGKGVKVFNTKTNSNETVFALLEEVLSNGPCLIEELIVQAEGLKILHPSSVNTVRCPTLLTQDGVVIFHPVLRMGRGGNVIDNAGAGGILANINPETGLVYTTGADELGYRYISHPDTGINIVGFQVPKWDELCSFVKEISLITPNIKYTGWDLALTDNGWVIVEGNHWGQFLILQTADKTGIRNDFEKLLELI